MKQITANDIRTTVEARMESLKPLQIIEWMRKNLVGKMITTRFADALNKAFPDEEFRLVRQYGMTSIENQAYRNCRYMHNAGPEMWAKSINLLLSHSELSTPLQDVYMTKHNTAYTKGAVERNAQRQALLDDPSSFERMAELVNRYNVASAELKASFAYGAPFSVESSAIAKAFVEGL